jgi:hypothetical protein
MHCPMCRSRLIRRSKRRGLVEGAILPMVFVRPYRCRECGWRFFRCSIIRRLQSHRAAQQVSKPVSHEPGARSQTELADVAS